MFDPFELRVARYEQHMQDLQTEAASNRLAREAPRKTLRCRVCMRLGSQLIATGVRLLRYGSPPEMTGVAVR